MSAAVISLAEYRARVIATVVPWATVTQRRELEERGASIEECLRIDATVTNCAMRGALQRLGGMDPLVDMCRCITGPQTPAEVVLLRK